MFLNSLADYCAGHGPRILESRPRMLPHLSEKEVQICLLCQSEAMCWSQLLLCNKQTSIVCNNRRLFLTYLFILGPRLRQQQQLLKGRYSHGDGRSAINRVRKYARILGSELVNHQFLLSFQCPKDLESSFYLL